MVELSRESRLSNNVSIDTKDVVYAGFWRRSLAFGIDMLLITLISLPLIGLALKSNFSIIVQIAIQFIGLALIVFSSIKFYLSKWQATPGKRFMRVFLTNKDSTKISKKAVIIRLFTYSLFITFLNIVQIYGNNQKISYYNKIEKEFSSYFPQSYKILNDNNVMKELLPANIIFVSAIIGNEFYDKSQLLLNIDRLFENDPNNTLLSSIYDREFLKSTIIELNEVNKEFIVRTSEFNNEMALINLLPSVLFLICFIIYYLPAAFTKQKTALHDLIAGTRVIKGRANLI